jgi:hypothetical protein
MNNILTISEYRNKYLAELKKRKLLGYFDSCTTDKKGKQYSMVLLPKNRWVCGGAWPGNATLSVITDYQKLLSGDEYEQWLKITVPHGYERETPSIENPISLTFCGNDDGIITGTFPDVETAEKILKQYATINNDKELVNGKVLIYSD